MRDFSARSTASLLRLSTRGNKAAADALFARVYDDLRRRAHAIRRDGAPATLNTTALVHEAYLHLRPEDGLSVESRAHLLHLAGRAMRQVVSRAVRYRKALKRGGHVVTVQFQDQVMGTQVPLDDLVTLDDALAALEHMHKRQARVVECRFYAGLTVQETAQALGISPSTVKRDWRAAKAWLTSHLKALD